MFLLSGQETGEQFRLDTLFFRKWYGYQDEIVMRERKIELIQVMCVHFLLFELKGCFVIRLLNRPLFPTSLRAE